MNEVRLPEDTNEAKAMTVPQEGQPMENAVVTMEGDIGTSTISSTDKKAKAKRGAAVIGNAFTTNQLVSPTLTSLKVIARGKTYKLADLDSGQIRAREHDPKRVELFASMYRDGKPVPQPVAIQVPDTPKPIIADGHRRCLGMKAAGFDEMEVDLYEGTELDVIMVGMELNSSGPAPLKPADIVKAAVKTQVLGARPNITKLADMAGVSRPTARKLYQQEISKTGGVLDSYKPVKPRKTKEEIADEIAVKVLEAIEEGNDEIIQVIFDKLPDDIRQHHLRTLQQQYGVLNSVVDS